MRFSIFVNSLTEYCFFWRCIRAIWRPWVVLGGRSGEQKYWKTISFVCFLRLCGISHYFVNYEYKSCFLSIFVNSLTEYCFFWICILAIWSLRAVLEGFGASNNIEKALVLCVSGAYVAFFIILSIMGIYHAFFHFCQQSNGILLFWDMYLGYMEPSDGGLHRTGMPFQRGTFKRMSLGRCGVCWVLIPWIMFLHEYRYRLILFMVSFDYNFILWRRITPNGNAVPTGDV